MWFLVANSNSGKPRNCLLLRLLLIICENFSAKFHRLYTQVSYKLCHNCEDTGRRWGVCSGMMTIKMIKAIRWATKWFSILVVSYLTVHSVCIFWTPHHHFLKHINQLGHDSTKLNVQKLHSTNTYTELKSEAIWTILSTERLLFLHILLSDPQWSYLIEYLSWCIISSYDALFKMIMFQQNLEGSKIHKVGKDDIWF